jgi:hypothetical protein
MGNIETHFLDVGIIRFPTWQPQTLIFLTKHNNEHHFVYLRLPLLLGSWNKGKVAVYDRPRPLAIAEKNSWLQI